MTRLLAALALLSTLLAGCASNADRAVLDHPSGTLDRPNGQPRWLPCMAGDRLCGP